MTTSVGTTTTTTASGRHPLTLPLIGVVGGFMSGLLGIGGGTVMVPLMVLFAGISQRAAHAISLAAIIPISIAAIAVYGGAGRGALLPALGLAIGAIVGARMGAGLLAKAPERTLKLAFGVFMLVAAIATIALGD